MFIGTPTMAGWTFNFVNQLRGAGYEHWFMLSDTAASCSRLGEMWAPLQAPPHNEPPLSCVWSTYPHNHSGWARWKATALYQMWSVRWWTALQLVQAGISVLSLDIDAALLKDVYADLHAPPLSYHDVLVTRHTDSRHEINCGFVYFNLRPEPRPPTAEPPPRGCVPPPQSAPPPPLARTPVPAAEWAAAAMWERLLLLLEAELPWSGKDRPTPEVLWEQAIWNDLVKSFEERRRVFPVTAGMAKESPLWRALGYVPRERNKTIGFQREALRRRIDVPAEAHAAAFASDALLTPLNTLPLCAPYEPAAAEYVTFVEASKGRGLPLTVAAAGSRPMASGSLAIAPSWLASLSGPPEDSWISATPSYSAYVHLTSVWRCFPHSCWSHTGRLFTARVNRFWDWRLDALNVTPSGRPFEAGAPSKMRALALPPALVASLATLVDNAPAAGHLKPHRGGTDAAMVPSDEFEERSRAPRHAQQRLAFKRFHMMLHNLVLVAALVGRRRNADPPPPRPAASSCPASPRLPVSPPRPALLALPDVCMTCEPRPCRALALALLQARHPDRPVRVCTRCSIAEWRAEPHVALRHLPRRLRHVGHLRRAGLPPRARHVAAHQRRRVPPQPRAPPGGL